MGDTLCPPPDFPAGGVYPVGFDDQDVAQTELRLRQILPDGRVVTIRDWQPTSAACDYYPLAIPANSGYLDLQIRFKSEPEVVSEGFLPLNPDQEYTFLSSLALTTSWVDMYSKLGIYQLPTASHISIDPALSKTIWLDPNPQYLQLPYAHADQDNHTVLWLGPGKSGGLAGTIWSTQQQAVEFRLTVQPAGDVGNNQRTVGFQLTNTEGALLGEQRFDSVAHPVFGGNLAPGPNQFQLALLDPPANTKLASGFPYPPLGILRDLHIATQDSAASDSLPLLPPMQAGPLSAPLITIDQSLTGKVSIFPYIQTPAEWGIEESEKASWLWLGQRESQGLGFTLDSIVEGLQKVRLELQVLRGPANPENQRTLELTIENADGRQSGQLHFSKDLYEQTTLFYDVGLKPGINNISLSVLDDATISLLPNDWRPLLVRVLHVSVLP